MFWWQQLCVLSEYMKELSIQQCIEMKVRPEQCREMKVRHLRVFSQLMLNDNCVTPPGHLIPVPFRCQPEERRQQYFLLRGLRASEGSLTAINEVEN